MKKLLTFLLVTASLILCVSCGGSTPEEKDTECGVGEILLINNLKVSLTGVEEYVDTDEWAMDVADEGKVFVVLKFSIENIGDEDEHFNMFYEESYCDDVSINTTTLFDYAGEEIWGNVAQGKKSVGYIAYEVDKDWSKIEFIYKPDIWNDETKYTFTANKSDLSN